MNPLIQLKTDNSSISRCTHACLLCVFTPSASGHHGPGGLLSGRQHRCGAIEALFNLTDEGVFNAAIWFAFAHSRDRPAASTRHSALDARFSTSLEQQYGHRYCALFSNTTGTTTRPSGVGALVSTIPAATTRPTERSRSLATPPPATTRPIGFGAL